MTLFAIALLAGGCDIPATLYPVDPCRIGETYSQVSAEVVCEAGGDRVEATFEWAVDTRAGGTQGEGWDGLGFYATGTSAGGGTLSVGHRPGALGLYGVEGALSVVVGYLPAGDEQPAAPHVVVTDGDTTCDAATGVGTVHVTGLPPEWVDGGTWEMAFDAGEAVADPVTDGWVSPWPADCPISPGAWAATSVSATCEGTVAARIQFQAPKSYAVELGALGQVASVSATWTEAFSASCGDGALPSLAGSLQGEGGVLRLYTPVLTVTRSADGVWAMEQTECGECAAWEIAVDGLPTL
ncbi:MAG: hypothetical protein Q8P18_09940 [Pseudomonadota bacterium]|nr:hypothetical protein [Pseudomonadota bacterium]